MTCLDLVIKSLEKWCFSMIFARTDKGYQVVITLFPRNRDARKEPGCDQMNFRAYLDDTGYFISKFHLTRDGGDRCMDRDLEEYQEYLTELN